jgi:P pilus assembly chaperone PapD
MKINKTFYYFLLFILFLSVTKAYVRVSPTILFLDAPRRSVSFDVSNLSESEVEVWVEVKYGYTSTNDSGGIEILTPDKINSDDQVATQWIKIYPDKFLLAPNEKRYLRIIVNSPAQTPDGEYWARVLVNSKPTVAATLKGKNSQQPQVGFTMQNQQSIPFHYRKGKVSTSVDLIEAPIIKIQNKQLSFFAKLQRFGNSSYWGRMNFQIVDNKGKVVKQHDQHFVVYKHISYNFKVDISGVLAGNYSLSVTAETKRTGDGSNSVLQSVPKIWKYPILIE